MDQIRLATRTDLALLHDIERAACRIFPAGRLPDPEDVMPMSELESACARQLVLVASRSHTLVGFAMSKECEGHLHLAVIAVHPDHARSGCGTRLVTAVIAQARERGLAGVTLTTFRDLPWNAPFYARLGFRILRDPELNPALRATLLQEERTGMSDRAAMLYPITGHASPFPTSSNP